MVDMNDEFVGASIGDIHGKKVYNVSQKKYLTKNCATCGGVAITISEEEYDGKSRAFFSYVNTKYCTECSDFWYKETRKNAQKNWRARRKIINKQLQKRNSMLQEYAERLVAKNMELQHELDMIKR